MNRIMSIPLMFCFLLLGLNFQSAKSQNFNRKPEEVAKLISADLLSRPGFMMYQTPGVTAVHYAEVLTGYGALKFTGLIKDSNTMAEIITRYDRVIAENIPNTANHIDANVYGVLPLEIYLQTNDRKYLTQGLAFADGQWENPLPDGLTSQTRYWIDDIYMIGCLQVQAFRVTGNKIYLERAALEIDSYIQKLQQPNGLFFHGSEAPFFWGRGNGWVAAGFAELLTVLPENNPHYSSILNAYKKMMKTLAENQSDDGMWCQLIDKPESFKETSSTAMFGFAMAVGVKKGILPEEPYTTAFVKAWNSLTGYLDEDGKMGEVCVGTGQSNDISYYLTRPRSTGDFHGQAPMLWFACTLMTEDYK
jgi:unsaturated rhamnogalacturonyl hydrolase